MEEEANRARQDEAERISKSFEEQIDRLTDQSIIINKLIILINSF